MICELLSENQNVWLSKMSDVCCGHQRVKAYPQVVYVSIQRITLSSTDSRLPIVTKCCFILRFDFFQWPSSGIITKVTHKQCNQTPMFLSMMANKLCMIHSLCIIVYQMLFRCMKNSLNSINIWDTFTNMVLLGSVYQAPSYEPSLILLAPSST